MAYIIAGLGNPGEEYEGSRHNSGRLLIEALHKKYAHGPLKEDKKARALVADASIGKKKAVLMLPETFMNGSGKAILPYIKSKKAAADLIVAHDDLDLPIGSLKISFGRGSGGHRGLDSVIKTLKTKDFLRVRVGIAPSTPSGKIKKPQGEKKIIDFLMGKFTPKELLTLKKVFAKAIEAIEVAVQDGKDKAMSQFN